MTTETPPIDPVVEAGLTQAQARVYRLAFELGLTRVISQTATRQELNDGLAMSRQDLQDAIAGLRGEMRFLFLLVGGILTALLSAILAIVA